MWLLKYFKINRQKVVLILAEKTFFYGVVIYRIKLIHFIGLTDKIDQIQ